MAQTRAVAVVETATRQAADDNSANNTLLKATSSQPEGRDSARAQTPLEGRPGHHRKELPEEEMIEETIRSFLAETAGRAGAAERANPGPRPLCGGGKDRLRLRGRHL